jgi:alpha-beta hydrolase superfamily lysophospholipase
MDNPKEVENHFWGEMLANAGFNVYTFDGPGQGDAGAGGNPRAKQFQDLTALWWYAILLVD